MTAPPPRYGAIVLPDRLPDGKPAIGRGPATVTPPPTKRTKTDEAMTTPAPQRWPGGPPTIPTDEGPIAGAATCSIIRPPVARGPGAGSRGRFAGLPPAWNPTGTVTTAETVRAECRREWLDAVPQAPCVGIIRLSVTMHYGRGESIHHGDRSLEFCVHARG